mmetsp:Transcript_58149/g.92374  ORF Transcript_58149/g.92374 Transcript_58149/m.92374 type:complete len:227 (+) Transcript_58149:223-903(+)
MLPCIRRSDSNQRSSVIKIQRSNRSVIGRKLADPFLIGTIPDIDHSVSASSSKRFPYRMKRDRIHWKDRLCAAALIRHAMALKRIFLSLYFRRRIKILDSHSALNRRHDILLAIGMTLYVPRLVLERRLSFLLRLLHVADIIDVDESSCDADHQTMAILHTAHCEHFVRQFVLGHLFLIAVDIPDSQRFVPRTGHDHVGQIAASFHATDRFVVASNRCLDRFLHVE